MVSHRVPVWRAPVSYALSSRVCIIRCSGIFTRTWAALSFVRKMHAGSTVWREGSRLPGRTLRGAVLGAQS